MMGTGTSKTKEFLDYWMKKIFTKAEFIRRSMRIMEHMNRNCDIVPVTITREFAPTPPELGVQPPYYPGPSMVPINWDWLPPPKPTILVAPIHPSAKMPTKSYDYALGYDFYVVEDDEWMTFADGVSEKKGYCLIPKTSHTFHTGIKVAITPSNYGFRLCDRSSLGVHDICVTAGVIEGTYRGEYLVHLINHGKTPRFIYSGDKIVQGILTEVIPATIIEVKESELPPSERGEKGFGSSG